MKAPEDKHNIIQSFEVRVFKYALIVGIIFRFIRTVHEYIIDSPLPILLLGIFNLLLVSFIWWLYRKHYAISLIIFYFQILFTSVITWNDAGGWNGTIPYIFIAAIFGIVITSHGLLQIIALSAYTLVLILFGFTSLLEPFSTPNKNYSQLSMEIDFLMYIVILVLITFYLKENFLSYRASISKSNSQLKESSETLIGQTRQLHEQKAQLNAIRYNLERMISMKTSEAQNKAEVLKEYAFVNAHHVRGPLARVLGLIYLIELEGKGNSTSETLHKIKRDAEEMDTIIKKINEIIS